MPAQVKRSLKWSCASPLCSTMPCKMWVVERLGLAKMAMAHELETCTSHALCTLALRVAQLGKRCAKSAPTSTPLAPGSFREDP